MNPSKRDIGPEGRSLSQGLCTAHWGSSKVPVPSYSQTSYMRTESNCQRSQWFQYANKFGSLFIAAAAKLLQSWPTLCDPIDGSPPGSAIPGILQARTLEWVAISFSKALKWKVKSENESEVVSDSSRPHGLQPTRLLRPWDFPGKSTGVGCHCPLRICSLMGAN